MIFINQDKLGIMGKQFSQKYSGAQVWSKEMDNDLKAFVFYNPLPYGTPTNVKLTLKELNLVEHATYNLYETFSGQLLGQYKSSDSFNATVNPSGSVFTFWAEPSKKNKKPALKKTLKNKRAIVNF